MEQGTATREHACQTLKPESTESIPGWEGIPETSIFNALIATVTLIFLTIIRMVYFKRKPNHNDWNISWLQFIYSDRNADLLHSDPPINRLHENAYLPVCLHEHSHRIANKLPETEEGRSSLYVVNSLSEQAKKAHQANLDNVGKNRHWLLDYLLIPDGDIYEHRGNDALQYLLFQRYIIYFMTALTAICMIILIPVNIYGKNSGQRYFEMSTISNIKESSDIFWIHAMITISVVVLGLKIMKNFSDLIFTPTAVTDERTILIQNVPEDKRNAVQLKAFIEKEFPGVEVTQVRFTYDVEALPPLKKQLDTVEAALHYAEKHRQANGQLLRVNPQFCGSQSASVDAATHYSAEREKTQKLIDTEVSRLLAEPKHAVFVQLKTQLMAQQIVDQFADSEHGRCLMRLIKYLTGFTSNSAAVDNEEDSFSCNSWNVIAAPFPDDIEWKDLVMNTNCSGLCTFLLNLLVLFIFIFLTTPLMAANYIEEYLGLNLHNSANNTFKDISVGSSKIQLAKYTSVLFFNSFSSVVPCLVVMVAMNTPRINKSEKHYYATRNVYIFLVLMVLIFPTIGLNSARVLLEKLVKSHEENFEGAENLYQCLFQPGASAWFVMMIISSVFINNSMELLRLPELTGYLINCIRYPRTEAEYWRARQETLLDFDYLASYPRFLLIFTIVTTYSVSCPIIAPFGLAYMILKHLVDRYSIYYLYKRPVISPKIHQMAITVVLTSFFFLLVQLTAFLNTRGDWSLSFKPSNVCTVACLLYLFLLIGSGYNFSSLYEKAENVLLPVKRPFRRTSASKSSKRGSIHSVKEN